MVRYIVHDDTGQVFAVDECRLVEVDDNVAETFTGDDYVDEGLVSALVGAPLRVMLTPLSVCPCCLHHGDPEVVYITRESSTPIPWNVYNDPRDEVRVCAECADEALCPSCRGSGRHYVWDEDGATDHGPCVECGGSKWRGWVL